MHQTEEIKISISTDWLFNLRLPILLYCAYKLCHRNFFLQFFDIVMYGILGNILIVVITSVINKPLLKLLFDQDFTLSQLAMFSCVTGMVDPITICYHRTNKIFYLFLGVFLFGNATCVDLFSPTSRVAYATNHTVSATTYGYLLLNFILDFVFGILLGLAVGLFTAYLSKTAKGNQNSHYYQPGIAVAGTALVYSLACYWTLSALFAVLTCCFVQERYVFINFTRASCVAVKDGLESIAKLMEGFFYLLVGYFLNRVSVEEVGLQVMMFMSVSLVVKAVVFTSISLLLNIKKKTPVGEMLKTTAMLVIVGSSMPRSWALLTTFQGGDHYEFFYDTHLLIITVSLVLDTLAAGIIYNQLEEMEDEEEGEPSGLVKWITKTEKELFLLFQGDEEELKADITRSESEEWELQIKKLEQHSYHQD